MGSIETFKALVGEATEELKVLPRPIARIAGPLRSGGEGLVINTRNFKIAEALLRSRGVTIFEYGGKYAEAIKAAYDLHFEHFHIPILRSGLIDSIYFLPKWETSNGASYERKLCAELGVGIKDITSDELSEFESISKKT